MASGRPADRIAPDGSPYPDRTRPTFERDVRAMFTHIAERYDWFDHVASLGNDFLWRPRALWDVRRFRGDRPIRRILDIGCGTGDLSRKAAREFPGAVVTGVDFTSAMLTLARARSGGYAATGRVGYARATTLALPFAPGTFDLVMSAFVVRNLPRLADAFSEMRRVLVPGGTLLTLEITEPPSPTVAALFHAYFDHLVPWLGSAVRSAGPYRYLPESLRHLPDRPGMFRLLRERGFSRVEGPTQSMGIVTSYLGEAGDGAP